MIDLKTDFPWHLSHARSNITATVVPDTAAVHYLAPIGQIVCRSDQIRSPLSLLGYCRADGLYEDMYDLAQVTRWGANNLHDLSHASWAGSVTTRTSTDHVARPGPYDLHGHDLERVSWGWICSTPGRYLSCTIYHIPLETYYGKIDQKK